jgi:GNAT superfamily N-acetyltransferase
MWWPLLKSLYAHDFTRFLERQFQLAAVGVPADGDERVLTGLTPDTEGFAMHCWRLHGLPLPRAERGERFLSFALAMHYRGQTAYHVQAAQLLMRQVGSTAMWDADHFFVPPGLWGIGIGGRFLSRITSPSSAARAEDGPLHGIDRLLVRVTAPRHAGRAAMKEVADLGQLYRDAGFRHVRGRRIDDAMVLLDDDGGRDAVPIAIERRALGGEGGEREWWFARSLSALAT